LLPVAIVDLGGKVGARIRRGERSVPAKNAIHVNTGLGRLYDDYMEYTFYLYMLG
jgi:hypothetical protein